MKTVYICSDTVTGIFSGIHDAWRTGGKEEAAGIGIRGSIEHELFCEYVEVEETEHKALLVEQMIRKNLGMSAYQDIYHAALSAEPQKGSAILGTMLAARKLTDSKRVMEHLSHPQVEKVFECSRNVGGEAHAYKGFLRFRELENSVLFAEIEPKNQVLTCLAPHFADRLPQENWMIYDKTHEMFVVHEAAKRWVLVWGECLQIESINRVSEREREFARLWKGFFETISIEERESRRRQLQHLPLRFQQNMVEFNK